MFGIVDINNFYASCEQLFNPRLRNKPLVVLSNNDGCVVARSKQAKALGIKMAQPAFELDYHIMHSGLVMRSSNYPLYADMSARVMQTLESLSPQVEIYSIDEAFMELKGMTPTMLNDWALLAQSRIFQQQGLSVGVGVAPTKTLAKAANWAAKQWPATKGIVVVTSSERQQRMLSLMPVSEVWGVGRKLAASLQSLGIDTAWQLACADPHALRRRFSVVLARTAQELAGVSCFTLEESPPPKQQILVSRSFGQSQALFAEVAQALSNHVVRAAEKLRENGLIATNISIFLHRKGAGGERPSRLSASMSLVTPSADSRLFLHAAKAALERIWVPSAHYTKAGVMLSDLRSARRYQPDLFASRTNSTALMGVIDQINRSGKARVTFASQGLKNSRASWRMRQNRRSPAYTTQWNSIIRVS